MAANPRIVAEDVTFTWDGAPQRLTKGTLLDVPPNSALERAIGRDKLVLPGGKPLPPVAEEAPQEEPAAARKASPAKTQKSGDDKDGDS